VPHCFFDICRDKEFGARFAKKYNGHDEHGASAYHIGLECGVHTCEPMNVLRSSIDKIGEGVFDTTTWFRDLEKRKDR
jgi:hypothetical protein